MTSATTPRPWLFAIVALPYGIFNGIIALALPYLLRLHGVPVQRIASIGAFIQAPAIWYFLWAPVVDLGLRRRTWVILLSVGSGACAAAALGVNMTASLPLVTGLLVAGSVINQPISSALGGLVATVVPNEARGRTAGWGEAGMLGGGVLAGAAVLSVAPHWPPVAVIALVATLIILPSAMVLAIREPMPAHQALRKRVDLMRRELRDAFRRRDVWVAFAFFASPVGSAALMNLFSAIAVDFHATGQIVVLVGLGGGLLTAVGALVGGVLCDRFDRWLMYPIAGLLAAVAAGVLLAGPLAPATYIAGVAAYSIAAGFGYAAFMSLALELLASGTAASGTRFTLFIAATNLPVAYMMWIEGVGHTHFGVHGMIAIDAAANGLMGLIFLVWVRHARVANHDREAIASR